MLKVQLLNTIEIAYENKENPLFKNMFFFGFIINKYLTFFTKETLHTKTTLNKTKN